MPPCNVSNRRSVEGSWKAAGGYFGTGSQKEIYACEASLSWERKKITEPHGHAHAVQSPLLSLATLHARIACRCPPTL